MEVAQTISKHCMLSLYSVIMGLPVPSQPAGCLACNFHGDLQTYGSQKVSGENNHLKVILPPVLAEPLPVFLLISVSLFILGRLKGDETP